MWAGASPACSARPARAGLGYRENLFYIASETPYLVGRAVATLAADPHVGDRAGGLYSSWQLAAEYSFTDIDGRRPDWGTHFAEHVRVYPAGPPTHHRAVAARSIDGRLTRLPALVPPSLAPARFRGVTARGSPPAHSR